MNRSHACSPGRGGRRVLRADVEDASNASRAARAVSSLTAV